MNQLRQRADALRFATKRVGQQLAQVVAIQRGEDDFLQHGPALADGVQLAHQGMGGADLVIPVGADQQEVLELGARQQVFEQVERGCVQPLQIVEKESERMLRAGEYVDEAPKHQLKPPLCILRRKFRHGRLFPDDVLQFRYELDHEQPVRIQRLAKGVAPLAQLFLVLAQERPDQSLEGLRQRGIRNVALVLVELARRKQAAGCNQRLLQLVDHRGFADARIA